MSAADTSLSFDAIHLDIVPIKSSASIGSSKSHGKFKMAAGGIGWKEGATGQVVTIKLEDMKQAWWFRGFHSGYTVLLESATSHYAFQGFQMESRDQIEQFFHSSYPSIPFQILQLDKRGRNCGQVQVDSETVSFTAMDRDNVEDPGKPSFRLPLCFVRNVAITGRAEVCLELNDPTIAEIRFHVPGKTTIAESDNEEELNEEKQMEKELLREQVDAAAALCDVIKAAAGLEEAVGETVIALNDVSCLVPRGRYDLEFTAATIRLHGKTYDHRISYSSILKLIVLPKADDYHILVVLQLDPPLRHGQTKYPFLVFSVPKDELVEVEPGNPGAAGKLKLQPKYDGPTFEVLASLIRQLAGQKIISPPANIKFSSSHLPCVRCTVRANEGHLYPLERALFYFPKPTLLIPYGDIQSVILSRSGSGFGNPRSFDMRIVAKGFATNDLQFSGISKEDLSSVTELFTSRSIQVVDDADSRQSGSRKRNSPAAEDDDEAVAGVDDDIDAESTDEDYKEGEGSSEDEGYDEDYESDEEDSVTDEEGETD